MKIGFIPNGYHTKRGYLGCLKSGEWMLFPTEKEYLEYVGEENSDET